MKVIIGAHGVGKSSLIQYINDRNPEIYTSDGFSRPINKLKFNERDTQITLNELTLWRWKEDLKKRNCLFSRSIIDSVIYMQYMCSFPSTWNKEVDRLMTEFLSTYKLVDKYFYIPIEFKLHKDGVRPTDEYFQKLIDKKFQEFIRKYQIPVTILNGTIEQRYSTIIKYL